MLTQNDFITLSIDLNLFFLRIMKEHSFFLQVAFTPRDSAMGAEASNFRMGFERLLSKAVSLAGGSASEDVLRSQQIATQYTVEAERLTNFYTGVPFDFNLTSRELSLSTAGLHSPGAVQEVELLDREAHRLVSSLIAFKERILSDVKSCRMFTMNYPLLIDHILREAKLFRDMLVQLVRREDIREDLLSQEIFWNRIMAEHTKFIAGLLDPVEEELIETARMFGREFDRLTAEAVQATRQTADIARVTSDSLQETLKVRDFKAQGTKGLLECKIQSIIIPLLGDHVLREANHYLCILGNCQGQAR